MELYEELKSVKIPYIENCVITHKDYDWLVTNFQLWAQENNADISIAVKYSYGEWIAQTYPYCKSKYRLLNILLITYILFEIDDKIDTLVKSANSELMKKYFEDLSETLQNPLKNNEINCETCRLLGKIWHRFTETITDNQTELIKTTLNDWFVLSIFVQTNYLIKTRYIPVSTYILYRRVDICVFAFIYFAEYALEFELKDHIRKLYHIRKLQLLTADRFFIAHDIIAGLPIEYMDGEIMNYVFAVKYENQCSFQEAVNITDSKIKSLDQEIKRCVEKIKCDSYILAEQPMIQEYINALNMLCYGLIEWNSKSVRYVCEHAFSDDVNWIHLKQSIENTGEKPLQCDPTLEAIIGEKNAKLYYL